METKHTPEPWSTTEYDRAFYDANDLPPRVVANVPFTTFFTVCSVDIHEIDRQELDENPRPGRKPKKVRVVGEDIYDTDAAWANAARIVACVNACAGIPSDTLEMPEFALIMSRVKKALDLINAERTATCPILTDSELESDQRQQDEGDIEASGERFSTTIAGVPCDVLITEDPDSVATFLGMGNGGAM